MALPKLTVTVGADAQFVLSLFDSDGLPITGYTGSETFAATVWPGESLAALFSPVASWTNPATGIAAPTTGVFYLTIPGASTAALATGLYRVLVRITSSGLTTDAFDGALELKESPGSATARPVYSTFQRMLNRASWLNKLQDSPGFTAGFADQRGEAREWLDAQILRHYRSAGISSAAYPCSALWGYGYQRTGVTDPWLKTQLANNLLIVSSKVENIVTLYAIGLVARDQVQPGGKGDYAAMADLFIGQAENEVLCLSAEIDLNNDGQGDIVIEMGTSDSLMA